MSVVILSMADCRLESREVLVYADLPINEYDMKWLMGSLAGLCWPAQSPFLALYSTRGLHALIPMQNIKQCWGLWKRLCSALFSPLAYSVQVFNATLIPLWKLYVKCCEIKEQNEIKDVCVCVSWLVFCHLDCLCIRGKCPFIYQGRALHPPIYKFNPQSKLGLITTALGHNQHPWSNQAPALDRKEYSQI